MPVEVPENFPIVPLIPVTRHPLFPKFIKMLEITNKDLMDLIRRKVKLNQPYAGIFLRKETPATAASEKPLAADPKASPEAAKEKDKNASMTASDVIKNLDEVYNIGAFVQIHEVHDMGDRLRMIVMAHRRIKIVGLVPDEVTVEEIDRRRPTQVKTNGNRRRQRRKGKCTARQSSCSHVDYVDEPAAVEEPVAEPTPPPPPPPAPPAADETIVVNKILLVNTENISHNEYTQTPELKVRISSSTRTASI